MVSHREANETAPQETPGMVNRNSQDTATLLEDMKLTGRMLGCQQPTAEVLGREDRRVFDSVSLKGNGKGIGRPYRTGTQTHTHKYVYIYMYNDMICHVM